MNSKRLNIELFRGETLDRDIPLKYASGEYIDLTSLTSSGTVSGSQTISGTVRRSYYSDSGTTLSATIISATSGTINLGLSDDVSKALPFDNGIYDVFLVDSAANERVALLYGVFIILPAATRFN
jgi:hypothetical protein